MRFLCVGYGSIGKRHTAILRGMGHEVVALDPRSGSDADCAENPWTEKLGGFNGVLDCTSPDVRAGWGYPTQCRFVEKPLGGEQWREHYQEWIGHPVMLGFCYRWLSSLFRFRESLTNVRIYSVQIVGGQWLPGWHPGTNYREHYHGTPGRGGVVLDSLPHSLFVARWILGDVQVVGVVTGKLSGLDIKTEDTAAVLLRAEMGQPCYLQADYLRRPRGFWIEAVTSGGVKRWDFDPAEADGMYHCQMEVFCQVCSSEKSYGYPDLAEGIAVQKLLDEVLRSDDH